MIQQALNLILGYSELALICPRRIKVTIHHMAPSSAWAAHLITISADSVDIYPRSNFAWNRN
jgi:hypothetical protein